MTLFPRNRRTNLIGMASSLTVGLMALLLPSTAHAGMTQLLTDVGRYKFSVDGWGDYSSTVGTVTINKPSATSTAKYVFASVTTIPGASDPGPNVMTVAGTPVTFSQVGYDQVYTRFDDITASVGAYFDALPAGASNITMTETGISAGNSDGAALYVVWEDASLDITTVALTLGSAFTYYDPTVTLNVAPVDTTLPGFYMVAGAAISFSAGSAYSQKSDFYFGATRITTEAGGYDDGQYGNGALFTVGGDGDTSGAEKYDLTSWATDGATTLDFYLHGYSPDDYCVGIWVEATAVVAEDIEYCGDGIVNGSEECDDGNSIDTDECSNLCIENCTDEDDDGHYDVDCGGDDCDDTDASINPDAEEYCNGVDDDCDGLIDTDAVDLGTWYNDYDGDAYGDPLTGIEACDQPDGYVDNDDDCDDTNVDINPGEDEYCNGIDDDCDGLIDNDAIDATIWYIDSDVDSYGDPSSGVWACDQPVGYVDNDDDCDDTNATINPSGVEICDDLDNDCDGQIDEPGAIGERTWYLDRDDDTWGDDSTIITSCTQPDGTTDRGSDCDDWDATVNPDGIEIPYDGIDQDCDGADLRDVDGDGYEAEVVSGTDCNDYDESIHPGSTETADGADADCDDIIDEGTEWYDDDGDGYTESGGDCDDANGSAHPGGTETWDYTDEDCDEIVDEGTEGYDDDGDGYAEVDGDCNDGDSSASPGESEINDNGVDDDCDGNVDGASYDGDGDGYSTEGGDCDDDDGTSYPGGTESADGVDNDCDEVIDEGTADYDDDGDGVTENEGDCDDDDASSYGGAEEMSDGADNDCDGVADNDTSQSDDDGDGYSEEQGDCDDASISTNPTAEEETNGVDDDCDGVIDPGDDGDADGLTVEQGDCDDGDGWVGAGFVELCDGIDNNCEGTIDEGCGIVGATEDTGSVKSDPAACGCSTTDSGALGLSLGVLSLALVRRRRSS